MAIKTARRIAAGIFLTLPLTLWAQVTQPIAGSVKKVTGNVMLRRGGASMQATEGMHILPHDVFETPADGTVGDHYSGQHTGQRWARIQRAR